MDKGYHGTQPSCNHAQEKNHGKMASLDNKIWNAIDANDHVIAGNYFGHLTKLWAIISSKFKWGLEMYDVLFCLCVALTVYHISFHPLRDDEDTAHNTHYKNCNYMIGKKLKQNKTKQKMSQKQYCEKHCK